MDGGCEGLLDDNKQQRESVRQVSRVYQYGGGELISDAKQQDGGTSFKIHAVIGNF